MTTVEILNKLGFFKNGDAYTNVKKIHTQEESYFKLDKGLIDYHKNDDSLVFSISDNISGGCLLVILQEYRVIHERFIYERVNYIEELFDEDDSYEDEE